MDLSRFSQQINAAVDEKEQSLPPVDKWDPPFCGELDLTIKLDGSWHYQGSPIARQPLIRLFASVLKKQDEQYFLVTPVEKVGIQVEDVPFIVTQWAQQEDGIRLTTNVGDSFMLSSNHPLSLRLPPASLGTTDDTAIPYVCVRTNLWARMHQNVYYQMLEAASSRVRGDIRQWYVTSEFEPFIIGEMPAQ